MHVAVLSLADAGWLDWLRAHPHDFYHRPEYLRLEAWRQEARAAALIVSRGAQSLFLPYLVRTMEGGFDAISPYGYPGMLLSDAAREPGFVAEALETVRTTFAEQGVCSAFLRFNPLLSDDFQTLFPPGALTDTGETVVIDLSLEDRALWKQLREGIQGTITKCKKAGWTPRFVPFKECLEQFLGVYEQTMDRVHAQDSYYFGRDYFAQLAEMPDHVQCCILEAGSAVASACLFLECDGLFQAHLGGTRSEFMKQSPFHYVLHAASLWAKARGNRLMHLGGGVGGAHDKLMHFKAGYSPQRRRFWTLRMICDPAKYLDLVAQKAAQCQVTPDVLLASTFFPAYRANLPAAAP